MDTIGRHLLAEYHACASERLDDPQFIEALMLDAARAAGATPLDRSFRRFEPQGVTGVVIVSESHLSVHTWPEHRYVAVDVFTCGQTDPLAAHRVLEAGLRPGRSQLLRVSRGRPSAEGASMQVVSRWPGEPPVDAAVPGTIPDPRGGGPPSSPD